MIKYLRLAEKGFIILGLTSFPGILYVLSIAGLFPQAIATVIKYSVWVTLIIFLCVFWKSTLITASQNLLLCILTTLTCTSVLWSESPGWTFTNATEVLMLTLFGLYFAARFNLKEQVQLIACALLVSALISTLIALGSPLVGIDQKFHPGAWSGAYLQKNAFGSAMLLSYLTFFALPKENSSLYRFFGFIFSLVLILLSTSKTSFVLSFLLISIVMFYKNFRWRGKVSVIFANTGILILLCFAVLLLTYWVELITGLGRDPSLTGRTPLWSAAIARLVERPLLGYGLGAFWAPQSRYAIKVGQSVGLGNWVPPHAHNGLLDIALDVGLIGLSLFLITYIRTFVRVLKRAYAAKNLEELWPLAFLAFLAMNNLTESYLMRQNSLNWILYVTVVSTMNQKQQIPKIKNFAYRVLIKVK